MDRSMTRANSPATSVRAKMKALSDLIRPELPIGGGSGFSQARSSHCKRFLPL
ncbi:MAG: hypothetical protein ACXVIG_06800 [Halobacteriota archaeon]